jgi:hypothetical protein
VKIDGTDVYMTRGDSGTILVKCKKDGAEVPFKEGDKVYFTVKTSPNVEEKLIQKVETTFLEGKAVIEIKPEDTKDLRFNREYYYDVQLTMADGRVFTIIKPSKFVVTEEVTYE